MVVLFIGFIEVLIIMGIIPFEVKKVFSDLVAGRVTQRIQLASGEPSWASMQLIFVIPIYNYLMKNNQKYKKYYLLSIILLLLTFSMQGYFMFLVGIILFILSENKIKVTLKYLAILTIFIVGVSFSFIIIKNSLSNDVYYITRVTKIFRIDRISDILYLDGSVFIRLAYPIIAILIFRDNFIIGVGGGNFRFELGSYILNYFPRGLNYIEVSNGINAIVGNPKNMYARLLSETGLFSSLIFLIFIKTLYSKASKLKFKNSRYVKLWIIFVLSIYLQFDSFAYIHVWLAFAVMNNLKYETNQPDLNGK